MENEIKDLDQLKQSIDKGGQKVDEVNILFLDLSSTCTGYSVASVNFTTRSAKFLKAGALWFNPNWDNQDKYHYIFKSICEFFYIVDKIDFCVCETYVINSKKMMGCQVSPELHGAVQVGLAEIGVKYKTILSQTWRSQLGIKPIITFDNKGKKKRDFKTPAKDYIKNIIPVASHIKSNITGGNRETPSDLFDAICLGSGFLKKLGIAKLDYSQTQIQPDVK